MKKYFTALKSIALVMAVLLIFGSMSKSPVNAKMEPSSSRSSVRSAASLAPQTAAGTTQTAGMEMPRTSVYALSNTSTIYVLSATSTGLSFTRLVRPSLNGNLIGIDFLPSDGNSNSVYGLTDTGRLYQINLSSTGLGATTLVSVLSPRFAGGYQALVDFNPVASALRVIGNNDQNFAVVSANNSKLSTTATQTALAYAIGDVNANVNPNISCGAYDNNIAGATKTTFFMVDYDLDTFVTIAGPPTATGSSNTGLGQLQTIGPIVTPAGAKVNVAPDADGDILTGLDGTNTFIGINGTILFAIDLGQINRSLPLGTTQNVIVNRVTVPATVGDVNFIDIAAKPFVRQ